MSPSPSLTLCAIARDEARFLRGCLDSVRSAVDQMVVVDTGSRDGTVEIARDRGAEVVHHAWTDDFAAARNAGLDRARGTHVLVLDADERLAPGGAEVLREACADPGLGLGLLPLHNANGLDADPAEVVSGARRMGEAVHLGRLFPRHPALRYRGRVHETLAPDLEWLERTVGGVARCVEAPLVHYGEVPELRRERGKAGRNTALLERSLREDPHDAQLASYLACEYRLAGRRSDAEALAARHWPGLVARIDAEEDPRRRPCPVRLGSVLALCLAERGAPVQALEVARAAAERVSAPHPNLTFVEGLALEALGRPAEAVKAYGRCLALRGRSYRAPVFRGVTGSRSHLRLASCLVALGRPDEIPRAAARARGADVVPWTLLRAEACLLRGEPEQALRWLGPLGRLTAPPADLFALTQRALEAAGLENRALGERARSLPAERWIEPRRRALLAHPARAAARSAAAVGDEGLEPPTSSL